MPKSDVERKRDQREREKLGLVHLNKWVPKKLWENIMKLISEYKN